jgi:uracil-DNA glycosylase family 4
MRGVSVSSIRLQKIGWNLEPKYRKNSSNSESILMSSFTHGLDILLQLLRSLDRENRPRVDQSIIDRIEKLKIPVGMSAGLSATDEQELVPTDSEQRFDAAEAQTSASTADQGDQEVRLAALREKVLVCTKCAHLAEFRHSVVFGVGNPNADLMFVGEAPGADEDMRGEPFVGRAGELLTRIIETMGFTRSTVYIANVLKCRPDMPKGSSGNRPPTPEEMQTCLPYLRAQIEIIQPKVMVALGGIAMRGLFGTSEPMKSLRGRWHSFGDIPVMATFHPSYLLRNQALSEKRKVWEDMLLVLERLQAPITQRQRNFFLTKS